MRSSNISTLAAKSPKLHAFFAKKHPAQLDLAVPAFNLAVENGGLSEFGFKRKPGINFNPRPARIPLIADQFQDRFEPDFYVACILSTIPINTLESQLPSFRRSFNENIQTEVRNFIENKKFIETGSFTLSQNTPSTYLNIFNFLDRLRHSHQAEKTEFYHCIKFFNSYLNLIPQNQKELALVFQTWHKRAQINLDNPDFK